MAPPAAAADILEHGPDEKALVLFTAFLCQRLMEVSREERAAMVMQRLWRRRQAHRPGERWGARGPSRQRSWLRELWRLMHVSAPAHASLKQFSPFLRG